MGVHHTTTSGGAGLGLGACALLAGCAQAPQPVPAPETRALEQRLQALEWRIESLERFVTALPAVPLRERAQIVQHIATLEAQRQALLARYTPRTRRCARST